MANASSAGKRYGGSEGATCPTGSRPWPCSREQQFGRSITRTRRRGVVASGSQGCFILFWTLFCWGFSGIGWFLASRQAAQLAGYRPVSAVVLSSRIALRTSSSGRSRSTSYTPRVQYRYQVGGQTYVSDRVFPLTVSGSWAAAQEVLARFPSGMETTAYYDPNHPAQAFLRRQVTFFPYLFILMPMAMSLLVSLSFGRRRRGWEPGSGFQTVGRWLALAAVAASLIAVGHYATTAARYSRKPDEVGEALGRPSVRKDRRDITPGRIEGFRLVACVRSYASPPPEKASPIPKPQSSPERSRRCT